MRVLVACEFSGVVREAFRRRGHDAWSCDLLPSEDDSPYHIQGDAHDAIYNHFVDVPPTNAYRERVLWDLMIAHPPCTYLTNSGVKHLYKDGKKCNGKDFSRWADMSLATEFFVKLLNSPIPRVCIENPIMHGYAARLVGVKYSQIIQPWMFGHGETKATCLWLKSLPILEPTSIVEGRSPRVHYASPGPDRWKERSRTLIGIADAMAEQWGKVLASNPQLVVA